MLAQQQLLQIIEQKLAQDKLVLPTLPEVVLKVRQQADMPNISLNALAEIISCDAALAARVIKVANSAFMGCSIKVSSLNQAVTRIGLRQIRNIVIAMVLEQIFTSKHPALQQQLAWQWQRNVQVTSIAVACLAYYNSLTTDKTLSLDVLTLAGLVHNIGALSLINEIGQVQQTLGEPQFLQHISAKLAPVVSEKILISWQFTQDIIYVAKHWRAVKPEPEQVGYADFIRIAMIAKDQYEDKELQQRLLDYYVAQKLVPSDKFMQQPEINTVYQNVRAVFS
ncbi:HDOD domain-containing protein [Rheinheimera sp. MMS21-TC3]|uniref:HDOD domain-containing protein n=1 Tax=Rheinheimera sp. MMS21-TC3 TaxID=3072790 RepID=UPI0028C4E4DB|nr:HDOD domain-containing protein [Rheinheimera sp. MMS21-TC3]WNO60552.1 HDOD domain-containing protein [Rheinheimera sp. MMS21-TC3]